MKYDAENCCLFYVSGDVTGVFNWNMLASLRCAHE